MLEPAVLVPVVLIVVLAAVIGIPLAIASTRRGTLDDHEADVIYGRWLATQESMARANARAGKRLLFGLANAAGLALIGGFLSLLTRDGSNLPRNPSDQPVWAISADSEVFEWLRWIPLGLAAVVLVITFIVVAGAPLYYSIKAVLISSTLTPAEKQAARDRLDAANRPQKARKWKRR